MTESPPEIPLNPFARVRAGFELTQAEFSETFGIGLRTIQALEQGVSRPTDQLRLLYCLISNAPEKVIGCARELKEQRVRLGAN